MDLDNKKILCLTRGGSHAYGLSTPTSDVDMRGVFVNTDAAHLVGLKRDEILVTQNSAEDKVMTELRHAIKLMYQANTQMVELLYTKDYEKIDPMWLTVIAFRDELVDTKRLFTCLTGYMQGELRLANGERTGKLGGKRKEAIDKYGFSPKNFVQLLRLAWAGKTYFRTGLFPVNIALHDSNFCEQLLDIKTNPHKYSKTYLNLQASNAQQALIEAYDSREVDRTFNEECANNLCLSIYRPLIAAL